jgi:hypothetical protein
VTTHDPHKLRLAADPAPSTINRGAIARLHWRHDVENTDEVARIALDPSVISAEYPAILAETHARLLDPEGVAPLSRPSPIGAAVAHKLTTSPDWQRVADAAALHPSIAREAVVGLAKEIASALKASQADRLDGRGLLDDLLAARRELEAARKRKAANPGDVEALRAAVEAGKTEEKSAGAYAAASKAGDRIAKDEALAVAVAVAAGKAEDTSALLRLVMDAGIGSALGIHDPTSIPQDVIDLLFPHMAEMLRMVGALRLALREGRTARHLPGREGMLGPDLGGLDRVGDLMPQSRAALAGAFGPSLAALERLRLIQGRAAVVEKGGGKATHGDLVVVVDKSGSMAAHKKNTWASALAMAIVLEARTQNRVVGLVTYDGGVRASILVDSPVSLRFALEAIAKNAGGDNNEHAALKAASALLASMRKAGDPADVLMITDGEWLASNMDGVALDRARVRIACVGGVPPTGAHFASVWQLDDMIATTANALDAAADIARSVV